MSFAEWLSGKMEERHMNQSELAGRLGVTRGAINNLLQGRSKNPSADTIQKLADIFHVPADEIYRAAGMLPTKSKRDELIEEAEHLFSQLESEDSKRIAINFLRMLQGDKKKRLGFSAVVRWGINNMQVHTFAGLELTQENIKNGRHRQNKSSWFASFGFRTPSHGMGRI